MFVPKMDDIYGSELIFLPVSSEMRKPGTSYLQPYKIKRTLVKGLSTPEKRCKADSSEAQVTQCITRHLEKQAGCSIGLLKSDIQAPR